MFIEIAQKINGRIEPLGNMTGTEGQPNFVIRELVLAKITNAPGVNSVVEEMAASSFTGSFSQTAGTSVSKLSDILEMGVSEQGNPGFFFRSHEVGTFEGVFSCVDDKSVTHSKTVQFEVEPRPDTTKYLVGADKTYNTIQSAIDAVGTTPGTIYEVIIDPGTYNEDITINKDVTVRGTDGDDSQHTIDASKTVIEGTVTFAADGGRPALNDLTVSGTGKTKTKTGIKVTSGPCSFSNLIVEDFAVGVALTDSLAPSGSLIRNCAVGFQINRVDTGRRSSTRAMDFDSNDVAIEVIQLAGPYSYNLLASNFTNNTTNIKNSRSGGETVNFAYNHFDKVDEAASFDGDVTFSPYYQERITGRGEGNGNLIYPDKAYLYLPEIQTRSVGFELPIETEKANKPIDTANMNGRSIKFRLERVGNDGQGTPIASWQFDEAKSANANTFNPAIATELKATSANAVDTLPDGATYRPVSFAHSGALPGTATVNVVKDATAPTENLKLYKVVGNRLVLQPDAVTFANGEYIFQRDGASDYLITDTEVTHTGTDSGSSGGSNDYVSSDEIDNKLENTTDSSVSISVAGKPNVSISAFDTLKKNPNKTLVFKGDGYSWSFKGSDIRGAVPGLIAFNTAISNNSPNAAAIKQVTGTAEIVNVYFGYHGQLPSKATVELAVDKKYSGKTLNFYYYNADKKRLETVATALPVKDGKVSVTITHCSDYILSPVALSATASVTQSVTNPETGATDRVPLALAVAMLSCVGALAVLRGRKPE